MRYLKTLLGAVALALLSASMAAAADPPSLTGQWELEITSPQGTRKPQMNLVQTGTQVTGTYRSSRGEVPISGTIEGADFALTVLIESPGDKLKVEYKGRVEGANLTGRVMMGARGEAAFTGRRTGT